MRWIRLRHPADRRQIAIVLLYFALLAAMYLVPLCRNLLFLVPACALSFLTAVVNHNHMHHGLFHSGRANAVFRLVLSFAALYPVSVNIPAHNRVHHHFGADGERDFADPGLVRFRWNLLNLLHFPNVAGPVTFSGVMRRSEFKRRYAIESAFAFGLTGLLLVMDFWTGLFFVVLPKLWGARSFLRINLIQHDACEAESEWNHSRNFVGKVFNWFMMNSGYHTMHHRRASLHWTELPRAHEEEVAPNIDPRLVERSMIGYLARTYLFRPGRERRG